MPTTIQTGSVQTRSLQNMSFNFNSATGNLTWRKDNLSGRNFTENFTYDNLDRLSNCQIGENNDSITYLTNGNIDFKHNAGTYNYGTKPHALTSLTNSPLNYPDDQIIEYNSFNKPITIKYSYDSLIFSYGVDNERIKTDYKNSSTGVNWTRKYIGNYEEVWISGQLVKKIHYISGGDGLAAIYIMYGGGNDSMYYVSKDYLGNIMLLTRQNGTVAEEYNYDAWGRRRNPNNWNDYNVIAPTILFRGYTGHEHVDEFALINMNGRVYDPLTGRFLSADNYVQMPDFTQSYNRYTYCWNNPLVFTDPSGEKLKFWQGLFFMFGGLIGVNNLIQAQENDYSFGQALGHYAVDVAAFAVGGSIFNGITSGGGDLISAVWTSGFAAGSLAGGGHTAMNGGSPDEILTSTILGGFAGGLTGLGLAGLGAGAGSLWNSFSAGQQETLGDAVRKFVGQLSGFEYTSYAGGSYVSWTGIDLPNVELCNFTFQAFSGNPITIINNSNRTVYYLSEDGYVGSVASYSQHPGYIDAIGIDGIKDRIFKVPGWPDKFGHTYGNVTITKYRVDLDFYGFGDLMAQLRLRAGVRTEKRLKKNGKYEYFKPLFDALNHVKD